MRESLGKKFEEIAEKAVEDASGVKCSVAEYVEGLELMVGHIKVALEAAREDLAADRSEKSERRQSRP